MSAKRFAQSALERVNLHCSLVALPFELAATCSDADVWLVAMRACHQYGRGHSVADTVTLAIDGLKQEQEQET